MCTDSENTGMTIEKAQLDEFEKCENFCRVMGRKWRMRILCLVYCGNDLRYSEIKTLLCPVTHKMLSEELGRLCDEGLLVRIECGGMPLRVKYEMSEKGQELLKCFEPIKKWIDENEADAASTKYHQKVQEK
ncbi:MAG: winged helix-turn-helix transcriptional regulator [Candidatus Limivicinus sp.]